MGLQESKTGKSILKSVLARLKKFQRFPQVLNESKTSLKKILQEA